ncbi:N-methyl-L-tryptophan oxidase [Paenibacillus sp. MBLB4367]|uniref:N-methyl-L-tryptophan oxidase n=1 Tax=Paenibacillus sp. MBLB4367 TaxID=3384767 RepID=UPI0039080EB8
MKRHYGTIVIGAGAMGMAAGYYLTQRGADPLLIDAFDPPHSEGSHHGESRIIRHAYSMDDAYVPLALRAQRLWNELERDTGRLFTKTGVLRVGSAGSAYLSEQAAAAARYNVPIEALSADEMARRWPGIRVPEGMAGHFEPEAGVLSPESCLCAYRMMAEVHGADLLMNTKVQNIRIGSRDATVVTAAGEFTAERLIVSAGAWTNRLLAGLRLPLLVLRKTVGWFQADEALFRSAAFPAFIINDASGDYYGFPSLNGSGLKVGRHDGGQRIAPDAPQLPFGFYEEDVKDLRRLLEAYFPQASASKLLKGSVCKYTMTPDEHFIVDSHPEHPHVWIAAGFSGHGFKFASAIGEMLSQLACDGKSELDRSIFAMMRPALRNASQS